MTEPTLTDLVARALAEDIGTGDATTQSTVPAGASAHATITQKQDGVLAGLSTLREVLRQVAPSVTLTLHVSDGDHNPAGTLVAELDGDAAEILLAERTALNFLQHLSGIATLTARYVAAVNGTQARILDTRKTTPGLRGLEKWAVTMGGGHNHRHGLYDMFMIKDNHIAVAGGITKAVEAIRPHLKQGILIEVETTTLEEVAEALAAGADIIMLDNMDNETMAKAVALIGDRAKSEASGNMSAGRLAGVALTGVDYISVGALTHSVKALDISQRIIN